MQDVTLKFMRRMRIIPEGKVFQIYPKTDGLFIELFCKAVSASTTFVFTMDALPDRFLSATDPLSWNRCTKIVIVDAFGAVSPGISAEMHLLYDNEIL
ncbi:hypothetical protein TNCV_4593011 [Trichonephila clavipes]|nr:hypothetical protein TNCV_4593011 [Trichonephila clavipes]